MADWTAIVRCGSLDVERLTDDQTDDVLDEVFSRVAYRVGALPLGATVLDLGANVGSFALRAASERRARVVAYEPDPRSFACLVANVERNGLAERVRCVEAAVAGIRGRRTFYIDVGRSVDSTLYNRWSEIPAVEVDVVTWLDAIQETGAHQGLVVKMDIEGAEAEIVADAGFEPALRRIDRLMIEWHGRGIEAFRRRLGACGFTTEHVGTILHAVR